MKRQLIISLQGVIDQVGAKAYYTGRMKSVEDDPNFTLTEVNNDENYDIIVSAIGKAAGKLQGVLGIYVPVNIEQSADLQQPELTVSMDLSANMDPYALTALEESIRQYCESTVLHDWFAAVSPKDSEHYAQQATLAIGDMRRAVTQRRRPTF